MPGACPPLCCCSQLGACECGLPEVMRWAVDGGFAQKPCSLLGSPLALPPAWCLEPGVGAHPPEAGHSGVRHVPRGGLVAAAADVELRPQLFAGAIHVEANGRVLLVDGRHAGQICSLPKPSRPPPNAGVRRMPGEFWRRPRPSPLPWAPCAEHPGPQVVLCVAPPPPPALGLLHKGPSSRLRRGGLAAPSLRTWHCPS